MLFNKKSKTHGRPRNQPRLSTPHMKMKKQILKVHTVEDQEVTEATIEDHTQPEDREFKEEATNQEMKMTNKNKNMKTTVQSEEEVVHIEDQEAEATTKDNTPIKMAIKSELEVQEATEEIVVEDKPGIAESNVVDIEIETKRERPKTSLLMKAPKVSTRMKLILWTRWPPSTKNN